MSREKITLGIQVALVNNSAVHFTGDHELITIFIHLKVKVR